MTAAAGFSEIGTRPTNEDSYAFWRAGCMLLAAVADGLGGMGAGDIASSEAVRFIRGRATGGDVTAGRLVALVRECHADLRALQEKRPGCRSMATTLTVMGIDGARLVAAHCGDTRLYMIRGGELLQLSEDHSEAQRLFREGQLTGNEFARYPKNILESALGIPGDPTVQEIGYDLEEGDWLFIASDGAYVPLGSAGMLGAAEATRNPRQFAATCRRFIETAGASDNYTMVVARVHLQQASAGIAAPFWRRLRRMVRAA